MEKFDFLPDMSIFPDCEEKRHIVNLAQKLELYLSQMTPDKNMAEIQIIHNKATETWWEMNAIMGAIVYKVKQESKLDWRWNISIIFSSIALAISIITLIIKYIK